MGAVAACAETGGADGQLRVASVPMKHAVVRSTESHRSDLNRRPPDSATSPPERKARRHKAERPDRSPAAIRKGSVSHPESATQVPRAARRKRPRKHRADSGP